MTEAEFSETVERFERITMEERRPESKRISKIAKLVNIVWSRAGMYDRIAAELTD